MAQDLTDTILQIDTDYPQVANLPMWLYIVKGKDRSAIIDTGVVSTYRSAVSRQLVESATDPHSITAILNTHGHPDHFGGNASWLAASPDAAIHAPLADAPWVEDHARHWRELWEAYPCCLSHEPSLKEAILTEYCGPETPVDVLLRDGDVIDLGRRQLTAVRTGAHSPDHLAFYDEMDKIVFSGDVVQGNGQPLASGPDLLPPLYTDPEAYREGLRTLLALEFDWLVPAHAPPLGADAGRALIQDSLDFVDRVDLLLDTLDGAAGVITTKGLAEAIGTRLGRFGGVSLQTAAVAQAHLNQRMGAGSLTSVWQISE